MLRTQKGWIQEYNDRGALWIHDGNAKRPHALLTSGNHSSGFFNSELVMEDPNFLEEACADLVQLMIERDFNIDGIDRVVGPAMGAITLAHSVACYVNRKRKSGVFTKRCLRAYTEKEMEGADKRMVFKKTSIKSGEYVLPVEDVLTTGGSVDLTAAAVVAAGGKMLPYIAVLVNRSGKKEIGGRDVIALIDHPMPVWAPEECPLCKGGSEAVHPKIVANWARLNAAY